MGSMSPDRPKPWIETPCIFSAPLSRAAGCNIYLKLDNLQPSGSFKSRGIGNLMSRAFFDGAAAVSAEDSSSTSQESGGGGVHFYCSSGGNAGLACATSALALPGAPRATIVVPLTAAPYMVGKLRGLGAEVVQTGENWAAADRHLREALMANHHRDHQGSRAVYVPPFDHPDVWAGAATLLDELVPQMALLEKRIDAVVCSVGGGGMLCGVMDGVDAHYPRQPERRPRVLAVETEGAASLHASIAAGELVTLPRITSIATSLGAPRVAAQALEWALRRPDTLTSIVVSDAAAVAASARFLDDARMLAEPACGATLATAYNGDLRRHLGKGMGDEQWAAQNVVLVVCGGSNINLEMLLEYKERFGV